MADTRRPGTVTAAGWLLYVQAAVGVLAIIALNALLGAVGGVDQRVVRIATGMGVALVVVIVLVATGVLRGRPWAWSAAVALGGLSLGTDALTLAGVLALGTTGQVVFRMLIQSVVLGLLLSGSARRYFRAG